MTASEVLARQQELAMAFRKNSLLQEIVDRHQELLKQILKQL